jgi:hypothetical protein
MLLGFGLGALVAVSQRSAGTDPRSAPSAALLRARAIEAQRISAVASQRARELAAWWSDQEAKERTALRGEP